MRGNAPLHIILFSTFNSEYAPFMLAELYAAGFTVSALILDGIVREKGRQIQEDRVRGFFEWPNFFSIEPFQVPLYLVRDHNNSICQEIVKSLSPDIIVNAGTPRILKEQVLSLPRRGVVNTHPGMLPQYRGCTCVEWALYHDDIVGATCHFMSPGIDEGPIIIQEALPICRGDVYEKVRADILFHQVRLTVKGVQRIAQEDLYARHLPPQEKGTYYGVIPLDKLAEAKKRLMRGEYSHYAIVPH